MKRNPELVREVRQKLALLTPDERLLIAQEIIGDVRHEHFVDHEWLAREAQEMANDPDIQRVLRGEDLPGLAEAYGFPETPPDKAAS